MIVEWDNKAVTSKASTLRWLRDQSASFYVPDLVAFTVDEWRTDRDAALHAIMRQLGDAPVAVRSSAHGEDSSAASHAGAFVSVLDVPSAQPDQLTQAVDTVIDSYQRNGERETNGIDEVVVQQMVTGVVMSGVVFTHDLAFGAPYLVINYDDVSGSTASVTSGDGDDANRTLYVHRGAVDQVRSPRFQHLLTAVGELEALFDSEFLDIEFAVDSELAVAVLQVRPITSQANWNRATAKRVDAALHGIQRFVRERFSRQPGVFGARTVFGQMPDWNPAEMIGRAPRELAHSLYTTLITDDAWRLARERMGYAVPDGQPLMVSLAGQPFVDTRLSFHSFLPAQLPADIGDILVGSWVDSLAENPHLHDKVEFDVAVTSYRFDLGSIAADQLTGLARDGIDAFTDFSRQHTLRLLADGQGGVSACEESIATLADRQQHRPVAGVMHPASMFALIEETVRFGTVPFSMLARHAFVARSLLTSLIAIEAMAPDTLNRFERSVHTIAGDLVRDIRLLQAGELSRGAFMTNYGFLRPGTYNILSPRYDAMELFAASGPGMADEATDTVFELPPNESAQIAAALDAHGFGDIGVDGLFAYARRAIAGREYAKFVFTHNVSTLLETVAAYAESHQLSRDEISHVPIGAILDALRSSTSATVEDELRAVSEANAEAHDVATAIRLPQVLFDEAGVHVVPFQVAQPNFVTTAQVTAPVTQLRADTATHATEVSTLHGRIVLIEGADPGFDWIFAHQIAGLVTRYGGANSHMAIRCAEFGLPAAICCGEQRYEQLCTSEIIMLDCAARIVQPVDSGVVGSGQ